MSDKRKTTALIILDGWGYRPETDYNAIANARTPFWDQIWAHRPHTLIETSGSAVGLPDGQMGNSEVGHMNLGAGRIVYQNYTRITKDILDGGFSQNPALTSAIDGAVRNNKAVHVFGLLSPGGVHSHEDQIFAACDLALARGAERVYLHAFLDGRDVPPKSARASIEKVIEKYGNSGKVHLASLCGRYYAMDRDNRWDRIEVAYNLLTDGQAAYAFDDPVEALLAAYERGETDEFVKPTLVRRDGKGHRMEDGDAVLFMNFRADRARELTRAFVEKDFPGFERQHVPDLSDFVMLTEYAADIDTSCAYPPESLTNTLGEYMMKLGRTQLRIAETEKYAHVTFFFSGGRETVFEGEDRILVPSPKVATYDMKPEMSAPEVTDQLVEAIRSGKYDLVVCNYANGDMVGHTGQYEAAVKAAEALDTCLSRVVDALEAVDGQALITADHGNAEQMIDPETRQPHTAHTLLPVPLIYIGDKPVSLKDGGKLSDVAPTLLDLMEITPPGEMTGKSLVNH